MKKTLLLTFLFFVFSVISFAGVTSMADETKDGTRFFYRGGKEIARWYNDKDGKLVKEGEKIAGNVKMDLVNADGVTVNASYKFSNNEVAPGKYTWNYKKSGKIESVFNYIDGERTYSYKLYYDGGPLREEGSVVKKKTAGPFIQYYSNGMMKFQGTYINGLLEGRAKTFYYEKGNVFEDFVYKNGVENGPYVSYHPNGKVNLEGKYKDGKLDGYYKMTDDAGILAQEGQYVKGNPEGDILFYDIKGKLDKVTSYKEGKKVKTTYKQGFMKIMQETFGGVLTFLNK